MNAGGATLDEQLRQFHDRSKTTVACVRIRDDGSEEISICDAATIGFWGSYSFFSLFAVMKELGHPQLMDFIRNGILQWSSDTVLERRSC